MKPTSLFQEAIELNSRVVEHGESGDRESAKRAKQELKFLLSQIFPSVFSKDSTDSICESVRFKVIRGL